MTGGDRDNSNVPTANNEESHPLWNSGVISKLDTLLFLLREGR
jgi:hypothetical protein